MVQSTDRREAKQYMEEAKDASKTSLGALINKELAKGGGEPEDEVAGEPKDEVAGEPKDEVAGEPKDEVAGEPEEGQQEE
jgi:hypothetical protein